MTSKADLERFRQVRQSVSGTREVLKECPRWDLLMRATREFVILRQVEMYDKSTDWKTFNEGGEARRRANAILPQIAHFTPWLEKLRASLLSVRGALYYAANVPDLDPECTAEIWRCRRLLGALLDDLDLALQVLKEPQSVFPEEAYYFDPDFTGVLKDVDDLLVGMGT